MDPNANLAEQNTCTDPGRLRELRQALQGWLARGGFEPNWDAYPHATNDFVMWRWARTDARSTRRRIRQRV